MRELLKFLPDTSRAAFSRKAHRYLVRRGVPSESIHFDEDEFALALDNGWRFNLGNAHAQFCRAWPWKRREVLDRFLGLALAPYPDSNPTIEEASAHLFPGVRHVGYFDTTWLSARARDVKPPRIPLLLDRLGSHLATSVFLDFPEQMRGVSPDDLDRWRLTLPEVFERAKANLATRAKRPLLKVVDGLYRSPWQDCYDSARLLLDDTFHETKVPGNLVVIVPTWNHMLVTGDSDATLLSTALEMAQAILDEEGRPTSAVPLRRCDGAWETLGLPKGHACEPLLRRLRVLDLLEPYADQKKSLEKIHQREGLEVFVATFLGIQNRDGSDANSYCTWTKGALGLLPQTDEIAFVDLDRPKSESVVGKFAWPVVWHHCHELMKPTEHLLPRFRVETFPTPQLFEAMAAHQKTRDGAAAGSETTA